MAKLPAASLLILAAVSTAQSQSGRKFYPVSTDQPAVEEAADYSESKPSTRKTNRLPFIGSSGLPSVAAGPKQQPAAPQPTLVSSEDVIRIETDLITIPVSVFDRSGLYIPNLQQSDFQIFEDGVQQDIAYFGTTEKPFTVVLLLDTSYSTNYKIEEIRKAAVAFVDQLKAQDAVMVVEFDGNINVLTEPTTIRPKIYKAISKADFGYGTSLYDAVNFSLHKRLSRIQGRKAIVLFTDGVDTTSQKSGFDSTIAAAEEADAMVFPIYYNTYDWNAAEAETVYPSLANQIGTRPEDYEVGRKYLDQLAEFTGGRVFRPEATPGGLEAAFKGIAEELRRQYNIGYIPTEKGSPGQRKQIRVRVNRPKLVIRSRDSYIIGASRKPAA